MKNLHTVSHPSLIRIYGQAPEEAQVLFLDESYSTEKARRRCLEKLLVEGLSRVPDLQGIIFEQRNVARDNNRDRAYLKKLEGQGLIPAGLKRAWVSPRDEIALWAPDIIGMAYRRTRTHQDATSRLFDSYLSSTARVFEI